MITMKINEIVSEAWLSPEQKARIAKQGSDDPTGKQAMKKMADKYKPSPEVQARLDKEKADREAKALAYRKKMAAKDEPIDSEPSDDGSGWAKAVDDEGKRRLSKLKSGNW